MNEPFAFIELPMFGGLLVLFASTTTFAFAQDYALLFIARSIQVFLKIKIT